MFGRQGNDTYLVDHVGDTVVEVEGQGTDTVYVAVPGYTLPDDVENGTIDNPGFNTFDLHGNSLGNFLVGDNVANYLVGGDGADILQGFDGGDSHDGGTGDDILDGGGWYDVLNGGAGADAMIGGSGLDTFLYSNVSDSTPASHDQIADFESTNSEPWDDQLDLSGIDADTAQAGDQAFSSLSQTPTAHGVWVTATTNSDGSWDYIIYGDVSGDTAADLEIHLHSLNGFLWQDDITM